MSPYVVSLRYVILNEAKPFALLEDKLREESARCSGGDSSDFDLKNDSLNQRISVNQIQCVPPAENRNTL